MKNCSTIHDGATLGWRHANRRDIVEHARSNMKPYVRTSLVIAALAAVAGTAYYTQQRPVEAATVQAPRFEVDPLWPKPLPNHWVTGSTIGVSVDAQDRVWTIHRPNTVEDNFKAADLKLGECCKVAPPVLVYDQAGNLVKSWGGPGQGYDWPDSNHG